MGQRQHKILLKRVDHSERELIVMVLAMNRILGKVCERIVHPTHIPFEPEPEAAGIDRTGHHRPSGGFFRDGLDIRKALVDGAVELLEELNGLDVLSAAVAVRDPFAALARVIEIEHRSHGIDAQAVGMILIEPEERVADKKTTHLMAAVVKNITLSLRVKSLARVGMLEQMRAVKISKPVFVRRKMRRHPIENDADTVLVQRVDQKHQILRRAIVTRRRKVTGDLIAP